MKKSEPLQLTFPNSKPEEVQENYYDKTQNVQDNESLSYQM